MKGSAGLWSAAAWLVSRLKRQPLHLARRPPLSSAIGPSRARGSIASSPRVRAWRVVVAEDSWTRIEALFAGALERPTELRATYVRAESPDEQTANEVLS